MFPIKNALITILFSTLLFSCNQPTIDRKVEEKKDVKEKKLVLENGFLVIDTFPNGKPKTTYKIVKTDTSRTLVEVYHSNGVLSMKGDMLNNERDGEWMAWDENHRLITVGNYVNGKEDGKKSVWYPNGVLYYEGNYSLGQHIGIWKFYSEDGKLLKTKNYDVGKK